MKHLTLNAPLLALAMLGASAEAQWTPTAAAGSPEAQAEIDARIEGWASPYFDLSRLSRDERARLAAHEGGISTHPPMTYDALGVRYDPIYELPLATFHEEIEEIEEIPSDGSGRYHNAGRELLYKFNIQLLSHRHRIEWPDTTTLLVDLSNDGVNTSVAMEMELREGNAYYIRYPGLFASAIREAIAALGQFPRMTLARLEGFEFSPRTISDMPPLGVAVTYNVRFGSVRVDTGFQWAGRPVGIPGGREDGFLK